MALLAFTFVGCSEWLDLPDPDPEPDPDPDPIEETLITLDTTAVTLNSGETYQINAECEYPITYTSEDEYVATVSEDGLVTANFVGSTVITLQAETDSQTFEVTVAPVSELYPEPEIEFGESKESVIERFGEPAAETEEAIGYNDYSDNTMMLMVVFDENDLVEYYAVVLDTEYSEELDTFLSERYLYAGEAEGIKVYINALDESDATMYVGSQIDEGFLMAIYMANTGDDGGDENDEDDKVAAGHFKTLLKSLTK